LVVVGSDSSVQALVESGAAESISDAFDRLIGEQVPGNYHVETEEVGATSVIEALAESGGVSSLAHPDRDLHPVELPARKRVGFSIDSRSGRHVDRWFMRSIHVQRPAVQAHAKGWAFVTPGLVATKIPQPDVLRGVVVSVALVATLQTPEQVTSTVVCMGEPTLRATP
jgi:hypothetical protein